MAPRRLIAAVLALALCTGCSTTHVVRLDTGRGEPLEYKPPTSNKPVKVNAESFEQALTQLVLEAPLTLRPPPQGWLVRASYPSNAPDTLWQRLMSKSFVGLCKPGQRRDDCLSLLDDAVGMTQRDKLGVALGLSIEPLKKSISQAVEKTLAPELFYTVIATGLISWAVLAANPEPVFTKAAAIVSVVLLIYLGVETFLALVDASRELKRATDKATTWEELEQAGHRFANRVGPEVARIFVLAVTVLVSHGMNGGAAWLASRLSMLPNFSELAAVGASRFGIYLANVGEVSAVAVSADGTITITLAPTAVAMTAGKTGTGGGTSAGALEIAEAGGRHAGFLRNYQGKPPGELRRGIDSLKKQIAEHEDKIANPEKHIPNWESLDPRQQRALIHEKWPSDIQRQTEQLDILEGLLKRALGSGSI